MGIVKNIYIVDRLVTGANHIMFNSAITSIISGLYPEKDIVFIAEKKHTDIVAKVNETIPTIKYKPFTEKEFPQNILLKVLPWLKKKFGDILFIRKLYRSQQRTQDQVIFFTCLSTTSLWFANFLLLFHNNIKAIFFLHGEIEYIFKEDISAGNKLKGKIHYHTLKHLRKNAKCIVLSPFIELKLINAALMAKDQLIGIEHPINETNITYSDLNKHQIIFGHLGTAVKNKDSEIYFEIAERFRSEIKAKRVLFYLTGKVDSTVNVASLKAVTRLAEGNLSIPEDKYIKYIQDIDYAIFTFSNNNYVLRSSGTIIDALYYGKPIIALKHDYIDYLFHSGGNIGFVCNSIDDMLIIIQRLINKDKTLIEQYPIQQKNLKTLVQRFSKDKISAILTDRLNLKGQH